MNDIERKIRDFISDELGVDPARTIAPETPLFEEGVIDSVNLHRLVDFVETRFGIKVRDEDLVYQNFSKIQNVATYVRGRLEQPETSDP